MSMANHQEYIRIQKQVEEEYDNVIVFGKVNASELLKDDYYVALSFDALDGSKERLFNALSDVAQNINGYRDIGLQTENHCFTIFSDNIINDPSFKDCPTSVFSIKCSCFADIVDRLLLKHNIVIYNRETPSMFTVMTKEHKMVTCEDCIKSIDEKDISVTI